ncbi:DMT family transporter [Consotaella salsifontis]|uniref:Threonine/homoserine efflux transporter RhtA n=1 Tax=Consotaella salsifontis TaxID=1365950 RepID=A0A1T4PTB1_9HYPH|nr:DMT family transporter [Consotaella salsifontis]SJZ94541.1 Threonine/homoserine efflux transporter RhtA [Consotaella salsifontis]
MSRIVANSLLLLAGAIWGMGFIAQSSAMDAVGPWTYTAVRFALASLSVLPFAVREARRAPQPLSRRDWHGFLVVGAMMFLGSIIQQVGIAFTSVTNAGFLTGLYVVITPLLAMVLLRHRAHWVVWPSAAAAFVGIVLIGGGKLAALGRGDALMVLCAVFWALQILSVGFFAGRGSRPLALSCAQFAITSVLSFVGMAVLEPFSLNAILSAWPEIVYGGVFSCGFAFTLQIIGQRYTTAPQAAIFLSSESLFAALFGAIVLGERIAAIGLFGCALIFAAMLAVELVPLLAGGRRAQASAN